jgi:hypothetical protein
MLINKGAAIGEVVTLKLVTSEELIGKLTEETDTHYGVERPLTLVMSAKGLGLQPWLFTVDTDKTIKIPKDKVLVIAGTLKEMSDNYLSGTSGIALA